MGDKTLKLGFKNNKYKRHEYPHTHLLQKIKNGQYIPERYAQIHP